MTAIVSRSIPARVPQQFTREDQAVFLDALSDWGNVRAAARVAGVSRSTAYRMRRACPRFRTLWDAALVVARPQVEEVLADRALNGVEEQVFYHGEEVAVRRRYDGRLLLAHLARLDRLVERREVVEAAQSFFAAVEELAGAHELEFLVNEPERADGEGGEIWPLDCVSGVSGGRDRGAGG